MTGENVTVHYIFDKNFGNKPYGGGTRASTQRAKDLRKNVFVFQEEGSTPVPPMPEIRVVLLHKRADVQSFLSRTVYKYF